MMDGERRPVYAPDGGAGRGPGHEFTETAVLYALGHSSWFTPDFIRDIHDHEPKPERTEAGTFIDTQLQAYIDRFFVQLQQPGVLRDAWQSIDKHVVDNMGAVRMLGEIFFLKSDKDIWELVDEYGVDSAHRVVHAAFDLPAILASILAPRTLQKRVIRAVLDWEGYDVERDVVIWAAVVCKGLASFAKHRSDMEG